jgi:hypothetical protein
LRKRVTGISFPYDPHYVSLFLNFRGSPRGSVRRASGLVLVGHSEWAGSFREVLRKA